jgi:hypothetical protein
VGDIVVCFWLWEKSKCLAWARIGSIVAPDARCEIEFSHNDPNLFTVVGPRLFRCFRKLETIDENNKKTHHLKMSSQAILNVPADISQVYSCHAWLSCENYLIIATAIGELIVCDENADYLTQIKNSPARLFKAAFAIECIGIFNRGFVVGGQNATVYVYRYTNDDTDPFECVWSHSIKLSEDVKDNDTRVIGVCVAPM